MELVDEGGVRGGNAHVLLQTGVGEERGGGFVKGEYGAVRAYCFAGLEDREGEEVDMGDEGTDCAAGERWWARGREAEEIPGPVEDERGVHVKDGDLRLWGVVKNGRLKGLKESRLEI